MQINLKLIIKGFTIHLKLTTSCKIHKVKKKNMNSTFPFVGQPIQIIFKNCRFDIISKSI